METDSGNDNYPGASISIRIPANDPDLFKHKSTNDLLLFLSNHRYGDYTVSRLAAQTNYSTTAISNAVDVLERNDLVETEYRGNARLVSINQDRLDLPDDPIMRIPQSEFREPTREAARLLTEEIGNAIAILLYGSVARGEADRRSDIDLWVLVSENRPSAQRAATEVAQQLEKERFNETGDRFEFQIDVETVMSIPRYSEDISRIINSGIPVYTTDEFEKATTIINNIIEGKNDE